MSHVIYALLDRFGVVRYVGQTTDIRGRLNTHRSRHKWFVQHIILEVVDSKTWKQRERHWIARYRSLNSTYNIADGGVGHPHTEQSRAKLSLAHRGKPKKRSAVLKQARARKGWQPSEETRRLMSLAHIGKKIPLRVRIKMRQTHARPEVKAKIRAALLGRIPWNKDKKTGPNPKHSEAIRMKWKKGAYANRKTARYWLGKKLPESIRANMRKGWVKRKLSQAERS